LKVLMFGWEFPPFNSGGLGTACYGLTKGLSSHNVEIAFVLPTNKKAKADFVKLIPANAKMKIYGIDSPITGYMTSYEYKEIFSNPGPSKSIYGQDLFQEVYRYSRKARLIARKEPHDIIHCHDWMTYKAGINAKRVSKKPLVVHVHATEFDRTGNLGVNQTVYNIEREGMHAADAVISVSNFTKNKIVEHYGVPPEKVHVVHNAVDFNENNFSHMNGLKGNKVVLFLGRITLQKGPDYFLYAAKRVLEKDPNVRFILAGSGDMTSQIIEKAAELGIGDRVLFTGFLKGRDIDKAYQMADCYVMPSVSEPFGITPLEAMRNNTPVIISKQSGVSEVVSRCFKVDFWDIDKMANQILGILNYHELKESLSHDGLAEVRKFSWNDSARKCIEVYNRVRGVA
jgi:glycosyltransferase involved in cell wall biosynthesis